MFMSRQVAKTRKEVKKRSKDPVCVMEVDEKKASARSQHMGKTY